MSFVISNDAFNVSKEWSVLTVWIVSMQCDWFAVALRLPLAESGEEHNFQCTMLSHVPIHMYVHVHCMQVCISYCYLLQGSFVCSDGRLEAQFCGVAG